MAFKQFMLDEQVPVTIYKRKSSRSLRLSITPDGTVRVSIPTWTPYSAGLQFARSRQAWITAQQRPARQLQSGQAIGKAHRLRFAPVAATSQTSSRLHHNEVIIYHPAELQASSPGVQRIAKRASIRALRRQAETLLPQRLASLAAEHNFRYGEVSIKHLKSRWGSCDQHGNVALNLFLMQLPWEHIDYVILHELTHTQVLRHGPDFWQAMETVLPDVRQLRKAVRSQQPVLQGLL